MATSDPAHLMRDLTRDLLLTGRLWRKMARAVAAKHGVSEAASAPLIWIDRLGENVRQNALADAIGIEGASLVRLIDELQASGLVTRDRGREVVAEVNEDVMALRRQVLGALDPADFEAALRVFAAIKTAAAKDGAG